MTCKFCKSCSTVTYRVVFWELSTEGGVQHLPGRTDCTRTMRSPLTVKPKPCWSFWMMTHRWTRPGEWWERERRVLGRHWLWKVIACKSRLTQESPIWFFLHKAFPDKPDSPDLACQNTRQRHAFLSDQFCILYKESSSLRCLSDLYMYLSLCLSEWDWPNKRQGRLQAEG